MTGPSSEPPTGGTNGWAIAAFVLGILGGTILSVIFAIVALFQIRHRRQRGRGLAIAALVISAAWIAIIASLIAYGLSAQGDNVRAIDLKTGDCVKDTAEGELPTWVKRVRCDRPHYGEVFAILDARRTQPQKNADPRSSTTHRTRRRALCSASRGQTASGLSFALRFRSMSGGHRCVTDASVNG